MNRRFRITAESVRNARLTKVLVESSPVMTAESVAHELQKVYDQSVEHYGRVASAAQDFVDRSSHLKAASRHLADARKSILSGHAPEVTAGHLRDFAHAMKRHRAAAKSIARLKGSLSHVQAFF